MKAKFALLNCVTPLVIFTSILTPAYALPEGGELSPARAIEVSVIKGNILTPLLGKSSEIYSVMAVVDGKLQAIPFQFDDVNERGFVYTPGGKLKINGQENIIEEQDQLALMYKDTGPQASAELRNSVEGKVVAEIVLNDHGRRSYAYVLEGNPLRSPFHYTHFNKDTGLIKTNAYSLQVEPKNLLMWEDFIYQGSEQRSLLDTMKLRVRVKMGFMKATITNRLIPNRIVAVKNGPVRSIIEMDAGLSVFGIQLATAGASVVVTENTTEFPVYITIPSAASVLADNLFIEISLDFDDLNGMAFRSELGPKEPLIAGDKKGNPADYKVDLEHNWLSASSRKNWDIIALFKRDPNFVATLGALYKDQSRGDDADGPERVEGSSPQVGYTAQDIPTGLSTFLGIDLFYSPDFWQGNNVEAAINEIKHHVPARVIAL
ncbi:MAG TPA: hypothetical protein VFV48_06130 [Pseudomonadales bacterium]|nr:hypothetical protein [Pseudomonadales bacterium]